MKKKRCAAIIMTVVMMVGSVTCSAETLFEQNEMEITEDTREGYRFHGLDCPEVVAGDSFGTAGIIQNRTTDASDVLRYYGRERIDAGTEVDYLKATVERTGIYEVTFDTVCYDSADLEKGRTYGWNITIMKNSQDNVIYSNTQTLGQSRAAAELYGGGIYLQSGDTIYFKVKPANSSNDAALTYFVGVTEEDLGYYFTRVAGDTRYDTAIEMAEIVRAYVGELNSVIIANAYNYPDALSGSSLSGREISPILLAGANDSDNRKTLDYIVNNLAVGSTVYILGGVAAIPESVATELFSKGYNVKRLGGATRYDTNLQIVNEMNVQTGTTVIVTSGQNYADALSISGYASKNQYPIILADTSITDAAYNKIRSIAPNKIIVVGGDKAVSPEVVNKLRTIATVERYAGATRYETSALINEAFGLDIGTCIASGANFPDALAGCLLAGIEGMSVLLVNDADNSIIENYFNGKNLDDLDYHPVFAIFGGTAAISDDTVYRLVDSTTRWWTWK